MQIGLILALTVTFAPQTATTIIQHVVENIQSNEQAKAAHLTFEKVVTTEDLDKPAGKRLEKIEVYRMFGHNGKMYEQLIERDGRPAHRKEKLSKQFFDQTIAKRFTFTLITPQPIIEEGVPCYLLTFSPTGAQEGQADDEKILNHLIGVAWIDAQRFYVRRLIGSLPPGNPIGGLGFLGAGTITEFSAEFRQQEYHELIIDQLSAHELRAGSILGGVHERETNTYRGFSLR